MFVVLRNFYLNSASRLASLASVRLFLFDSNPEEEGAEPRLELAFNTTIVCPAGPLSLAGGLRQRRGLSFLRVLGPGGFPALSCMKAGVRQAASASREEGWSAIYGVSPETE